MPDPLQTLRDADLRALSDALVSGRLTPSYTAVAVARVVGMGLAAVVSERLTELATQGLAPAHVAVVLKAIADARASRPAPDDAIELVLTGPSVSGVESRDTAVVVRELFAQAVESVVVAGFAVFQGRELFRGLADRMRACPALRVQLFLDVHRPHQDSSGDSEIVQRFARRFVEHDWPAEGPLPEVYYDPRSLDLDPSRRASLHAKCVVADRRLALVTSANFTEAAHERNVEAGVVIRSPRVAARLADHFTGLVSAGTLTRVRLPGGAA